MKPKDIEKEILNIEIVLRELITEITINKTVALTGKKYQDIQAFVKHRRKWSYEKILNIAEKLDIY